LLTRSSSRRSIEPVPRIDTEAPGAVIGQACDFGATSAGGAAVAQVAQTVAEDGDPEHDEVVATRFRELWAI
jgi:hypothetical protein